MSEQRLTKIEKDMAVVSEVLQHVSTTIEKMSDLHLDTRILAERFSSMDRELIDSFKRIYRELDKLQKERDVDRTERKTEKLVFLTFALSVVGLFIERLL